MKRLVKMAYINKWTTETASDVQHSFHVFVF